MRSFVGRDILSLKDFEREATRVESALAAKKLKVSNLTFDPVEARPFDEYKEQFEAVARLAARLNARLINLMAPSTKADRQDQVDKLRVIRDIARRHGVSRIEGYPVTPKSDKPIPPAFAYTGLPAVFESCGFRALPRQGFSRDVQVIDL